MPMIAGGGGLPVGYAAGGASAVGMMNNAAGGLSLTAQPGSWVISQAQGQQSSGNSPSLLPGGLSRVSLNHMHGAHEGQQMGMMGSGMMGQQMGQQAQMQSQMQAQYQRMAALNQLASLERIAALNQVLHAHSCSVARFLCETWSRMACCVLKMWSLLPRSW
jgi:hypothetical protein